MKTKFKILIVGLVFLNCFIGMSFSQTDYSKINQEIEQCKKEVASKCFSNLLNKYDLNLIRFNYALALETEKNYAEARKVYNEIILNEKKDKNLVERSKTRKNIINERLLKMKYANNYDAGDYFDETKTSARWQKPYNIKVYISNTDSKRAVFKKAFQIWDDRLYKLINFTYVDNPKNANIICSLVDNLPKGTAGVTKYGNILKVANHNYLQQVKIEVALNNYGIGQATDTNILATTLHEIGHALGITYHSDSINDIMYYSTESYKNITISSRDVNTIKKLYR